MVNTIVTDVISCGGALRGKQGGSIPTGHGDAPARADPNRSRAHLEGRHMWVTLPEFGTSIAQQRQVEDGSDRDSDLERPTRRDGGGGHSRAVELEHRLLDAPGRRVADSLAPHEPPLLHARGEADRSQGASDDSCFSAGGPRPRSRPRPRHLGAGGTPPVKRLAGWLVHCLGTWSHHRG
jgi:hypothetical protein